MFNLRTQKTMPRTIFGAAGVNLSIALLSTFLTVAAAAPVASHPEIECADWLKGSPVEAQSQADFQFQPFTDAEIMAARKNGDLSPINLIFKPKSTVQILPSAKPIAGQWGGQLRILEALKGRWNSNFSQIPAAVQGDPRIFIHVFGVKIAEFFGYHKISDWQMTAPNSDEANGAIRELNKILEARGEEKIGISFYNETELLNDHDYLNQFVRLKALPLSTDRFIGVHDLSFHLGAIIIPNDMLDSAVEQTHLLQRFIEHLRLEPWSIEKAGEAIEPVISDLEARRVNLIDIGTARIVQMSYTGRQHNAAKNKMSEDDTLRFEANAFLVGSGDPAISLGNFLTHTNVFADGDLNKKRKLVDYLCRRYQDFLGRNHILGRSATGNLESKIRIEKKLRSIRSALD